MACTVLAKVLSALKARSMTTVFMKGNIVLPEGRPADKHSD
jgi:hypothetical protein